MFYCPLCKSMCFVRPETGTRRWNECPTASLRAHEPHLIRTWRGSGVEDCVHSMRMYMPLSLLSIRVKAEPSQHSSEGWEWGDYCTALLLLYYCFTFLLLALIEWRLRSQPVEPDQVNACGGSSRTSSFIWLLTFYYTNKHVWLNKWRDWILACSWKSEDICIYI